VYNCWVAEYHTYFVGDQEWGFSIWSHNLACVPGGAGAAGEAGAKSSGAAQIPTVRVYRVERLPNTRIIINEAGEVTIVGDRTTLFLNFGSRARAEEFLAQRIQQEMPGATIKSFEVPRSFLDQLRAAAVPERLARQYPGRPIIVDVTRAPDQFGLRPEQIQALRRVIIQGTGRQGH